MKWLILMILVSIACYFCTRVLQVDSLQVVGVIGNIAFSKSVVQGSSPWPPARAARFSLLDQAGSYMRLWCNGSHASLRDWWSKDRGGSSPLRRTMKLTKIVLDEKNRMLRLGFGKNDGNWFVRIDLWSIGFRITK